MGISLEQIEEEQAWEKEQDEWLPAGAGGRSLGLNVRSSLFMLPKLPNVGHGRGGPRVL